jgi:uncharacterized protein (DUF58 family)
MATRISIRPSALGSKGLLLFAVLELAFLATNYSNLFFLMIAFSAVLGTLGAFWAYRNLRGIHVAILAVNPAACKTARAIELQLSSDARPRFDLVIELPLANGFAEVGYAAILVTNATTTANLPGQPRGVQALNRLRVTSGFPFGLFVARASLAITGELVTHPTPAPMPASSRAGIQAGDHGALTTGRGSALAGLRAFRSGDGLADVHWKATARRGKAVVKERERESKPAVEVVLDRRCDPATLESALSQLTSLVLAARHGSPLRMHSQGMELLVDPDRGGSATAMRWLAEASILPSDAAPPPRRSGAMPLPFATAAKTQRSG